MLYLASKNIDFASTYAAFSRAKWWVLIPYFLTMAAQHFFRVWRWKYLLEPIHPVPFRRLLPVASVGFCAILALPLRMGELVRPYLIADPPHLRMSHGFGTLAVERVFDGIILALACFASIALAKQYTAVPNWLFIAGLLALALFCVALVVLVMTLWQRERAVELCRKIFSLISPKLGDRVSRIAQGIVEGFQVLPNTRRLMAFLNATFMYWLLNGLALWLMSFSFDMGLNYPQSIALMSIIGVGIMIPAGPGFIGNFELFAQGALSLYVLPTVLQDRGAAFILTSHGVNALWYVAVGALALFSPHITIRKIRQATVAEPKT